jgi:hypothetical protein
MTGPPDVERRGRQEWGCPPELGRRCRLQTQMGQRVVGAGDLEREPRSHRLADSEDGVHRARSIDRDDVQPCEFRHLLGDQRIDLVRADRNLTDVHVLIMALARGSARPSWTLRRPGDMGRSRIGDLCTRTACDVHRYRQSAFVDDDMASAAFRSR